jgi:hypothetical protein
VLDEGRNGESLIQTVPTRGYRFVAPVSAVAAADSPAASPNAPDDRPAGADSSAGKRRLAAWAAALLVVASSIVVAALLRSRPPTSVPREAALTRLTANPADVVVSAPHISRDGRVAAWSEPEGIRVQAIDSGDTRVLPGTAGLFPLGWGSDSTVVRAVGCEEATCRVWEIPLVGEGRPAFAGRNPSTQD